MIRRPQMNVDGYSVRRLGWADVPAVRDLFERCGDHFELHDHELPGPEAAAIELGDVPPGRTLDDKHVHGIADPSDPDRPDRLIGLVESVTGYPDESTWFLGLLLIDPAHRGRGLGGAVVEAFERMAGSAGYEQVRLAVIEPNVDGRRFWEGRGYEVEAVREHRPFGRVFHRVLVMVRRLPDVWARVAVIGPTSTPWDEIADEVEADLARVVRPGLVLEYRCTGAGPAAIRSEADVIDAAPGVVATALAVAADGFDGAVVDCTDDPGVADAAARVAIPVVGAGAALRRAIDAAPRPVVVLGGDDLRAIDSPELDRRVVGAATVALGATGWTALAARLRADHPDLVVLEPFELAVDECVTAIRRGVG